MLQRWPAYKKKQALLCELDSESENFDREAAAEAISSA